MPLYRAKVPAGQVVITVVGASQAPVLGFTLKVEFQHSIHFEAVEQVRQSAEQGEQTVPFMNLPWAQFWTHSYKK